jgi:hypothetical protein
MRRQRRRATLARRAAAAALLASILMVAGAEADDRGYLYPYAYPYDPYWDLRIHDDLRLSREVREMNDKLRRQQLKLDEQIEEQQEQTRLLRQQESAQQRATGRQACFHRMDGALNLCDRLFKAESDQHADCVETVNDMHPGCAWELSRRRPDPAN